MMMDHHHLRQLRRLICSPNQVKPVLASAAIYIWSIYLELEL
jgi:hypothetical protein